MIAPLRHLKGVIEMPSSKKSVKPAAQESSPSAPGNTEVADLLSAGSAVTIESQPARVAKAVKTKATKPAKAAKAAKAKAVTTKTAKAAKTAKAKPAATKATKTKAAQSAATQPAKAVAAKTGKATKPAKTKAAPKPKAAHRAKAVKAPVAPQVAQILSSEVVYQGPLFRVLHDKLIEPSGKANERDVIRHNGSVVILGLDNSDSKKNPWVVLERQYRHAANQYLWELPAGKLDAGEDALAGAQRELAEETGYTAKKWKPLVEYYASPGFLGESMKVFLAEGLIAGAAHPEEDEQIEYRLVKLHDVVRMIDEGMILDGKTLTAILLYVRKQAGKHKK
jgi:ADP-ribose pyrophosphatase